MYYAYKIGQFLVKRLTLKTSYSIAAFIATLCYIFCHRDRKALVENISMAVRNRPTKRQIRAYTRRASINFAKYLVDFFRFQKHDLLENEKIIELKGKEKIDKALKQGKGALLLSSHVGNWELGAALLGSLGYEMFVIALDHTDKRVNEIFIKRRKSFGVKVIPLGPSLRRGFKALRENKLVAILGDRDFTDSGERIEFFGKETLLPRGPASFSLRTGAPILPAFVIRTKANNCRLIIEDPIKYKETGTWQEDIKGLMTAYVRVIERYIRRYPDQWYVFRKVWDLT